MEVFLISVILVLGVALLGLIGFMIWALKPNRAKQN